MNDPSQSPLASPLQGKAHHCWEPVRENPRHRQMVAMATEGFTPKEIAQALDYKPQTVAYILGSNRSKDLIVKTIAHNAQTEIRAVIERVAKGSIARLADMAEDEELKFKNPKLFSEINQSFVDRLIGKAPVVLDDRRDPSQLSDEEIDSRINELRSRGTCPTGG